MRDTGDNLWLLLLDNFERNSGHFRLGKPFVKTPHYQDVPIEALHFSVCFPLLPAKALRLVVFTAIDGHTRSYRPFCTGSVMWKKWSTPKTFAGDSQDNLGTPLSQQSRSLGLPPTPTGRQASQHLPRQEQDGSAVFQLCERISAFAYGKSKLQTVDASLDLSEALPIRFSIAAAAPERRSVAMHGGGHETSQSHKTMHGSNSTDDDPLRCNVAFHLQRRSHQNGRKRFISQLCHRSKFRVQATSK